MGVQPNCCQHWNSEDWPKNRLLHSIKAILSKEQQASEFPSESTLQCLQCATRVCGPCTSEPCCEHPVMFDIHKLELYCRQCRDYIYVQQFDEALALVSHMLMQQTQQPNSCSKRTYIAENDPAADIQAKRQKLLNKSTPEECCPAAGSSVTAGTSAAESLVTASAVADTDDSALDAADTVDAYSLLATGKCKALRSPDGFPLGLRGLNNLGNTCFMNSVLQVMFHTPLLSAFFLGEGHDSTTCPLTAKDEPCLSCQMESIFGEVYSGNRQPCSPAEFLYQWWRHADSLAGYQQQDAHEFYLSLLEGMSGSLVEVSTHSRAAAVQETGSVSQKQPVDCLELAAQASCTAQQQQQQHQASDTSHQGTGADVAAGTGIGQVLPSYSQGLGASALDGLQQQTSALPGTMHGHGMYLHNDHSNGYPDWKQLQMQLLQQHALYSWPQSYLQSQQQPGHDVGHGAVEQAAAEPLSMVEMHTAGSNGQTPGLSKPDEDGVSLVELLFSGLLRSDVSCSSCGHTSTAYDPFRDISLDLHVPRPPKLPPLEPLAISPAAAEATASLRTAAASEKQEQKTPARGGYTAAGFAEDHAGGGEYSGGAWASAGREVTPPLLLVTPSPTPPPSDPASDYWDNTEDAADTAAGGPTYSEDISLSAKPSSVAAALPAAGGDGGAAATDTTGQLARPEPDGEESSKLRCHVNTRQQISIKGTTTAASLTQHGKGQMSHKLAEAGSDATQHSQEAAVQVPALQEQLTDVVSIGTSLSADNEDDTSGGDKSPQVSEVWGPAGSQSSLQCDNEDRADGKEGGLLQQSQHIHGGYCTGDGESNHDTPQRQQQLMNQFQRECTPQSAGLHVIKPQQQHPAVQQHASGDALHQQPGVSADAGDAAAAAGSSVASTLVRGVVSGGLGQLVRAPVAAIKQLLPAWSTGQQQEQQVGDAEHRQQLLHQQQYQQQQAGTTGEPDQQTSVLPAGMADAPAKPPVAGTATQPTHPTGGMQLSEQPQLQRVAQQQQQQGDGSQNFWPPINTSSMQQEPQHSQQQHWQYQPPAISPPPPSVTTAAAVRMQQKPRSSPKPGSATPQDLMTIAAVQQGLLKKRDERGRFYRKEHLQAWAQQLYEEGHLKVEGLPEVSQQDAAAARARGLPQPPNPQSAQAGTGPVAGNKTSGGGGGAAAAAAAAGGGGRAVRKSGDVHTGSAASEYSGAVKKIPPPPQLRMNELSLAGCLRRFVRPERLGAAAHWCCSACGSNAAAMKQMSVRRLPLVLCFHVKRFEHGGSAQRPKKLDVPMRFPLGGLDMFPFTTSGVLRGQAGPGMRAATAATAAGQDAEATPATPAAGDTCYGGAFQQKCLYELFGIVSHHGDISSGHYVSYVKSDGCWYLINDAWVVAVSEADVAQAQAYMLFYAQEHLFGSCGDGVLDSSAVQTAAFAAQQQQPSGVKAPV